MSEKILFVDDEANLLSAVRRQLRKRYDLETAESGADGLEILKKNGPFAVVVADMRMPRMDGVEFLSRVKTQSPQTVRLMLTGNADMQTAIDAVNEGNIFRFLTKPCPPDKLDNAIQAALEQHRLIRAEKVLTEQTLKGSIRILTEILSLVNPTAFSRTTRIRRYVKHIVTELDLPNAWQFELAAMLSQIGCVTIPPDVLALLYAGDALSEEQQDMYAHHPETGGAILAHIPRMEVVSAIIRRQNESFSNHVAPLKEMKEYMIATGAQLLRVVNDFDQYVSGGMNYQQAITRLRNAGDEYNQHMIDALENLQKTGDDAVRPIKRLPLKQLAVGMLVLENITAKNGLLIVPKGYEITYPSLIMIQNFARGIGVNEPVVVQDPE